MFENIAVSFAIIIMKKISVVIPVYFNEKSLPHLFEKLLWLESELLNKFDLHLELIFVDDGSGDNSLNELLNFKQSRPTTTIIKLTRNFGGIHAVKKGFQRVTGDCFMMLAADLQDPPELILELASKWIDGSKFIICERISREDSWGSKLLSLIYYRVLRLIVVKDYPIGGYDLALMDQAFLPFLQNSSKSSFPPILAYWLGYKPEIILYHRNKRLHGKSRWTFRKKINTFLDVMLGFSVTPIRLISIFGFFVSFSSFIYGLTVVINTLLGSASQPGYASIAALITFLLGLTILMLGVIGEYLWRVFDEVNKRPEAVIEEIW